jgi:hypothetical protein
MSELLIRFKRTRDGSAALTCVRADGSVTWQRQRGSLGLVFPPHDLTHYAVETTLGYRSGFYGLVADGWDLADFAQPWPRGPIPLEAVEVELIVGFFDTDRRVPVPFSVDEFNAHAERYVAARRMQRPGSPIPDAPELTGGQIDAVRTKRAELLDRWNVLGAGDELVLEFDRGAAV